MNKVELTGNLTRDPDLRRTASGISVANITVAVNRVNKGPNGEKQTDFINVVCWDKKAEYIQQYARKGDRVELDGKLESRKYTDQSGNERTVWEVIADNITSFNTQRDDKKDQPKAEEGKEDGGNTIERNVIIDDDLPF